MEGRDILKGEEDVPATADDCLAVTSGVTCLASSGNSMTILFGPKTSLRERWRAPLRLLLPLAEMPRLPFKAEVSFAGRMALWEGSFGCCKEFVHVSLLRIDVDDADDGVDAKRQNRKQNVARDQSNSTWLPVYNNSSVLLVSCN